MGRPAARHHDRRRALILLKTNMDAGHGGASGRFDRLEEVALQYAFALACDGPERGGRSTSAEAGRGRRRPAAR